MHRVCSFSCLQFTYLTVANGDYSIKLDSSHSLIRSCQSIYTIHGMLKPNLVTPVVLHIDYLLSHSVSVEKRRGEGKEKVVVLDIYEWVSISLSSLSSSFLC
jgi:hypothetical protein